MEHICLLYNSAIITDAEKKTYGVFLEIPSGIAFPNFRIGVKDGGEFWHHIPFVTKVDYDKTAGQLLPFIYYDGWDHSSQVVVASRRCIYSGAASEYLSRINHAEFDYRELIIEDNRIFNKNHIMVNLLFGLCKQYLSSHIESCTSSLGMTVTTNDE